MTPNGWLPIRLGRTTAYWMYTRSGAHVGSVGMPQHNNGLYTALLNYTCDGQPCTARRVGTYHTRIGAMHAVERESWVGAIERVAG